MSWIENIRNKTQKEKLRIIWIVAAVVGILLVLVWIFTSRFNKSVPKDTTLFKTVEQGIKDVQNNYKNNAGTQR